MKDTKNATKNRIMRKVDTVMERQEQTVQRLQEVICSGRDPETALWEAVIACQSGPFRTTSGLPFSYTVKQKKNGDYSGELMISRKEGSKTLTRSSVMLVFHRVLQDSGEGVLPFYRGPKAIGQIFGISYIYSLFWNGGLIDVPEKVAQKLRCGEEEADCSGAAVTHTT